MRMKYDSICISELDSFLLHKVITQTSLFLSSMRYYLPNFLIAIKIFYYIYHYICKN